ncbi:hypothetical protein E4U26_002740 [Claviceps purpurea]|nr:hypothetical protein E4U26_002740 [Claviceps purpurea]
MPGLWDFARPSALATTGQLNDVVAGRSVPKTFSAGVHRSRRKPSSPFPNVFDLDGLKTSENQDTEKQ